MSATRVVFGGAASFALILAALVRPALAEPLQSLAAPSSANVKRSAGSQPLRIPSGRG
jgi:hypothetical protein